MRTIKRALLVAYLFCCVFYCTTNLMRLAGGRIADAWRKPRIIAPADVLGKYGGVYGIPPKWTVSSNQAIVHAWGPSLNVHRSEGGRDPSWTWATGGVVRVTVWPGLTNAVRFEITGAEPGSQIGFRRVQ